MFAYAKTLRDNRRERTGVLFALPVVLFLIAFFIVPTVLLFVFSFWQSRSFVLVPDASLTNYIDALTRPAFRQTILTGLTIGLGTATVATVLSYPVAWFIAYRTRTNLLLYIIMLSWFSSYLVRIFAWRTILGTNGLINSALLSLGVIDAPLEILIFSPLAVTITLVHIFVPFTLLLLLSALRNVTPDFLAAARDLGASRMKVFFRVTLPIAYKGFVGSFMFTFILAAGDFITPQLLGGRTGITTGLLISNQFRQTGNWPSGAAMAFILMAVFLVVYFVLVQVLRWFRLSPGLRFHPPVEELRAEMAQAKEA
ncbi:ABC transporter permease [Pseudogemmobacter humi]|uniref:Putrescine transport system permease protein PotH n=1 Tax=Pseudogemmobacter humi TaxID=2483812 RepID=A0A3P5XJA5_9RHOB|nr:ABC transporter permease [Pseudogemmobacter humi]VDC28670.1 Putrescine transport system permease protein PotH [Pseudogemmobacter humi]